MRLQIVTLNNQRALRDLSPAMAAGEGSEIGHVMAPVNARAQGRKLRPQTSEHLLPLHSSRALTRRPSPIPGLDASALKSRSVTLDNEDCHGEHATAG
jgi:hypothetical protein